jgi:hypothetical protein
LKKLVILVYPVIVYIALRYGSENGRREVSGVIMPICAYYNVFYITIMAIAVKRNKVN